MAIIKSFNFYSSVWKQQTLSISVCITLGTLEDESQLRVLHDLQGHLEIADSIEHCGYGYAFFIHKYSDAYV